MEVVFAAGTALRLRSDRDRSEGLGQNDRAIKFLGQDFETLRAQCLQSKRLFEDNYFPAKQSSLGFKELAANSAKTQGVRWMRPTVSQDVDSVGLCLQDLDDPTIITLTNSPLKMM